jgi:hypothetical protein
VKKITIEINELKLIQNINILFENKIILYGAGRSGLRIYRMLKDLGIPVTGFCDGDMRKCGTDIDGVNVMSPIMLKRLDTDTGLTIIIATEKVANIEQMMDVLAKLELKTKNIFTAIGLDTALGTHANDPRICEAGRQMLQRANRIKRIVGLQHVERSITDMFVECAEAFVNGNAVLVYQPGKVASTSIAKSLSDIGILNCHVHVLNRHNFYETVRDDMAAHYDECVKSIKNSGTVKIITLVREPVARLVALFLEMQGRTGIGYIVPHGISFMGAIQILLSTMQQPALNQFEWFDGELKAVFGVDIYRYPFDREKGYQVIRQGNVEVLAMKYEKLNELEGVIGEFVGAPHFRLASENVGNDKPTKSLYKNIQKELKLPRGFFEKFYEGNPLMDHVYTAEEKSTFWKKWENNIK